MEGATQLRSVREIWGCLPEYWATGKPRLEADVRAACEGLLAGGATELVVLDNHGGNTVNVSPDALPPGARLETWRDFDLHEHDVDATLQVGYHARGGVEGFISHTYVPGLRLRVDGELVSESHGRAWASGVPLLGIVGNDLHRETLGSLSDTPYLVAQRTVSRSEMEPVFGEHEGLDAIREFSERCVTDVRSAPPVPARPTLEASMPNGRDVREQMAAAGWERAGEVEFVAQLERWDEARDLLAAAMNAALVPFLPYWLGGFESAAAAAAADPARVEAIRVIFDAWAEESHPEWYTEATDPFAPGIAAWLADRPAR
ncbi:MAG: D-amino peptidase [Gaiellaceae bacterium]|jgi:D-amino peptidase|nr:D-amino peptidase [Gaiellaceae bacterium]